MLTKIADLELETAGLECQIVAATILKPSGVEVKVSRIAKNGNCIDTASHNTAGIKACVAYGFTLQEPK